MRYCDIASIVNYKDTNYLDNHFHVKLSQKTKKKYLPLNRDFWMEKIVYILNSIYTKFYLTETKNKKDTNKSVAFTTT